MRHVHSDASQLEEQNRSNDRGIEKLGSARDARLLAAVSVES